MSGETYNHNDYDSDYYEEFFPSLGITLTMPPREVKKGEVFIHENTPEWEFDSCEKYEILKVDDSLSKAHVFLQKKGVKKTLPFKFFNDKQPWINGELFILNREKRNMKKIEKNEKERQSLKEYNKSLNRKIAGSTVAVLVLIPTLIICLH